MTDPTAENKTNDLHGPNLILDVENFGPIAEAKNIEFKPMTVFVGPSNTGKTYLAMVLHAFLKTAVSLNSSFSSGSEPFSFQSAEQLAQLFSTFNDDASDVFRSMLQMKEHDATPKPIERPISDATLREFQIAADHAVAQFGDEVKRLLTQFFEVDPLDQMSASHNSGDLDHPNIVLSVLGNQRMQVSLWGHVNRIDVNHADLKIIDYLMSLIDYAENPKPYFDDLKQVGQSNITAQMNKAVHRVLSNLPYSVYLPTGRTGIMNAHRILTSHIIESAAHYGIEGRQPSTYHLLARDFLRSLIELRDQSESRQHSSRRHNLSSVNNMDEVADIIEQSIVNGHIRVRDTSGLPDFEYEHQEIATPMFRASSMVTEFAPIVMFLRNYIKPNDLLIIDEPEAHLHPSAQQQMAAALAFIVRSGVRVLFTTHSHYMVEQISDFVAASNLSPEKRRELLRLGPILEEQDIYLNEDEVEVYGFDNSTGSTVVKDIPFDETYAYAPADHIQALHEQFNRNVGIMRAQRNGHSVNGHDGE